VVAPARPVTLRVAALGAEPLVVEELFGLTEPDREQGTPELFHRISLVGRRAKALELLAAVTPSAQAGLRRPLAALEATFQAAPPEVLAAALDHPFLHTQLRLVEGVDDARLFRGPLDVALGLARFFVGVAEFAFVLPERLLAGGFYLPHQNAVLTGPGPVAVVSTTSQVELTFTSGERITLPAAGEPGLEAPQLRCLGRRQGLALMNGVPEVCGPVGRLLEEGQNRGGLAEARALESGWLPPERDLVALEQGLELLGTVWPEALQSTLRTFRGLVAVPHRLDGHFLSLTTGRLRGALIAGLVEPVQVGDSLIHEGAHTRLWPVFEVDPLLVGEDRAVHPSPWRRDPRPLKGLLNGVHAFANVCQYYQRIARRAPWAADTAAEKLAYHAPKVREAWAYLRDHAEPTPLGALLFAQLSAAVEGL
jgi:HEXXH motif-containing protein